MSVKELLELGLDELMADPTQPRKTFLDHEIRRLADSLLARGFLQPLRVRWDKERKTWVIVIGESRWRAARLAGLTHVLCLPMEGEASEADYLMDRIVENDVRNPLLPIEHARAIDRLLALKRCTAKQLAVEIGLSISSLSRSEKLLSLPEDVQALIDARKITADAGYLVSQLPDAESQRQMAEHVIVNRLSRDDTAKAVKKALGKKPKGKTARLPLRLSGGLSINVTAKSLTWDSLLEAIEQIRNQAEILKKSGKPLSDLAGSLSPAKRGGERGTKEAS